MKTNHSKKSHWQTIEMTEVQLIKIISLRARAETDIKHVTYRRVPANEQFSLPNKMSAPMWVLKNWSLLLIIWILTIRLRLWLLLEGWLPKYFLTPRWRREEVRILPLKARWWAGYAYFISMLYEWCSIHVLYQRVITITPLIVWKVLCVVLYVWHEISQWVHRTTALTVIVQ